MDKENCTVVSGGRALVLNWRQNFLTACFLKAARHEKGRKSVNTAGAYEGRSSRSASKIRLLQAKSVCERGVHEICPRTSVQQIFRVTNVTWQALQNAFPQGASALSFNSCKLRAFYFFGTNSVFGQHARLHRVFLSGDSLIAVGTDTEFTEIYSFPLWLTSTYYSL